MLQKPQKKGLTSRRASQFLCLRLLALITALMQCNDVNEWQHAASAAPPNRYPF